jgi:hypothetical protein
VAVAGSVFLLVAMVSTLYLAVDIVYQGMPAALSAGAIGLLAVWLWFVLPLRRTLRRGRS